MAKFYFHIKDGDGVDRDDVGIDFASVKDARDEAVIAAREMLVEKVANGEVIDGQIFVIEDENGTTVAEVPFKSAVGLA